jgi:hypothetical protein
MKSCCQERRCGWVGDSTEMLSAPDPFTPGEIIHACPQCRTIEHTVWTACEYEGCNNTASWGWPDKQGEYHHTCHEHGTRMKKEGI